MDRSDKKKGITALIKTTQGTLSIKKGYHDLYIFSQQ